MESAEVYKKALELICTSWVSTIKDESTETVDGMKNFYIRKAKIELGLSVEKEKVK
jgi:RNA binding exosome subunit